MFRRFLISIGAIGLIFMSLVYVPPVAMVELEASSTAAVASTYLYVNGFNEEYTGWTRTGSSPWLDAQDQPDNMVDSSTNDESIGNFTFADLPSTATSVINATLEVYIYSYTGIVRIDFNVWDGTSWNLWITSTSGSWAWVTSNITDWLDTVSKVNGAQLWIQSNGWTGYNRRVDCVRLLVWYEYVEPDPQAGNVGTSQNIIARNSTFACRWTDDVGLSGYIFSWNNTDTWINDTWVDPWSGNPTAGWSNVTRRLRPQVGRVVGYRFYANDTDGNWGDSGIHTLTTSVADYSTSRLLDVADINVDESAQNVWISVGTDVSFTVAGQWNTFDNVDERGKWIKLEAIDTGDSFNWLKGYEFEYYNGSAWRSPNSIHSVCGGSGAGNLIDGDTDTYWYHYVGEFHWVVMNIDYEDVQQVRIYVTSDVDTQWTGVDIYVGKPTEWDFKGSKPWIDETDHPINYIYTDKVERKIGDWNFTVSYNTSTVLDDLILHVNASGTKNFKVGFWDGLKWSNTTLQSPSSSWSILNFTLNRLWWSQLYVDAVRIRFYSGSSLGMVKIDKAWITYRAMDRAKMINWVFDNMVARMVNNSFPLVRSYSEYYQSLGTAGNELLAGTLYYVLTGNETMLNYAGKYVDWLNNTGDIKKLWMRYDPSTESWEDENKPYGLGSSSIQYLATFVGRNSVYKPLLQQAVDKYLDIWFPDDGTGRPYNSAYFNGTPYDDKLMSDAAGRAIDALIYSGSVLDNETVIQKALDLAFNYSLSSFNIPYHQINHDGTPYWWYSKQYSVGFILLGFNSLYFWTGNETVKNKIKDIAENVAVSHWSDSLNRFYYRIDNASNPPPPLGSGTYIDIAEKTMPIFHDSLMVSYLTWQNSTWLDKLKSSWRRYIDSDGLTNDLLPHQGAGSIQSDLGFFTAFLTRTGSIYYNLNRTGWYHNQTFMEDINRLYGAQSAGHMGKIGTLGWVKMLNASNYSWYTYMLDGGSSVLPLSALFPAFMNLSDGTINNYDDYWNNFGDPFTGDVPPSFLTSDLGSNDTRLGEPIQFHVKWRVPQSRSLSHWRFSSNNTGVWQNSSWYQWTGSPTAAWSRYNTTLNDTADVVEFRFYANDSSGHVGASKLGQVRTRTWVVVTVKPNNQQGILYKVNVTALRGNAVITSDISNMSGLVVLTNIPYGNATFIAYAGPDHSQIIANISVNISTEGQSLDVICDQNFGDLSSSWEMIIVNSIISLFSSRVQIKKR